MDFQLASLISIFLKKKSNRDVNITINENSIIGDKKLDDAIKHKVADSFVGNSKRVNRRDIIETNAILDNIKQAGVKTTSEQTEPDLPKPETQAQDEAKFFEDINKETQEAVKKFEEENKPTLSSKLEADSNGLQ